MIGNNDGVPPAVYLATADILVMIEQQCVLSNNCLVTVLTYGAYNIMISGINKAQSPKNMLVFVLMYNIRECFLFAF